MSSDGSDDSSTGTPAALAAATAVALLPAISSTSAGRPDEGDAGVGAGLRQLRVLGQESVAGVDRVGAGGQRGPDDLVDVQVGADRMAALADLVGLVGLLPVHGVAVLVGKTATEATPSS